MIVTNGWVAGVDLIHQLDGVKVAYGLKYEYGSNNVPAFLPSKVSRYLREGTREILIVNMCWPNAAFGTSHYREPSSFPLPS